MPVSKLWKGNREKERCKPKAIKTQKKKNRITQTISRLKESQTEICNDLQKNTTIKANEANEIQKTKKKGLLDDEVNVRAIFTAYHIGTAGYHIGKALGMIGVMGAASFECNFARHSAKIGRYLREVAKEFMVEAMTNEVIATLTERHDELEIEAHKTTIKQAILTKNTSSYFPIFCLYPSQSLTTWVGKRRGPVNSMIVTADMVTSSVAGPAR